MPSPPPGPAAGLAGDASHPGLTRRSSFEPLRLGALPPPVFTRGGPGQRSVPAVEFLKQEAAAAASANALTADGTTTPDLALGNGAMSKEPWNLWPNQTGPGVSLTASESAAPASSVEKQAEELASALAAASLAEDNAEPNEQISKRSSLTTWHEEPVESLEGGGLKANVDSSGPSLLPRNVSFSSLLDLPSADAAATGGSPLKRSTSLKYNSGSASLASANASPLGAGATKSLYSSPVAPSTIGQRQARTASNSPTANLTQPFGHIADRGASGLPANSLSIGAGAFAQPGGVSAFDGIDAGLGMRSRQPSTFSDVSIASMPFGSFFNSIGSHDPFGSSGPYGGRRDSGYGLGGQHGRHGRQDKRGNSTCGYNSSNSRSMASFESLYSPSLGPSPYPFSSSPGTSYSTNPSSGMASGPASIIGGQGLIRFPSNGSSNDGMMPNFSLNGNIPPPVNYGLGVGMVAPASPYMSYGPPLAPMQSHYPFGGLAMSAMPGNELYQWDRPRNYVNKSLPIRSPLLEEFRADKGRAWGVRDMQGHIAEFMTDQIGSRYIQEHILQAPTADDIDLIFEEIQPVIVQLSTDVFANFSVQSFMEKASVQQVDALVQGIQGSVLRLCLGTYSTRVIQKALEVISDDAKLTMIRELEPSIAKCARDQNANFAIAKIIQTCPADSLQGMLNSFIGHVYSFATHPYSTRILQRFLENCPERMTRPLIDEVKSYSQNLMQDPFGNYVVQYILEKGSPQDRSDIVAVVFGQVLHLSKHKFASNVVEKCIMNANDVEIQAIAAECLAPRADGATGVQIMLRHEYANYPLQRLIKHTTGQIHLAIVDQVCQQLTFFKMTTPPFTAKHLIAVEKLLLDLTPADFPSLIPRTFNDHYVTRR